MAHNWNRRGKKILDMRTRMEKEKNVLSKLAFKLLDSLFRIL